MLKPILSVDLSTGASRQIEIPASWQQKFLGGASLAARLLYPYLSKDLAPLSPEAPLLFMTGPLTGTSGPTTGRFVICGKSPATGLWAESHIGGFWGPELCKAGYSGLWVTGMSPQPVYLWLEDGRLEVRDASRLWGRDCYETQDLVKSEIDRKNARVCTIGPAGEKQVLFASIMCDHGRLAGRTGLGAVMGAKNLKAVAVRGTGKIEVVDLAAYAPLRSQANHNLKNDNEAEVLHDIGTAGALNYSEYIGALPSKYYSQGAFPDVDLVSGATMTDTILAGYSACQGCVIACGRVVKLEDGNKRKGPEYETVAGFGPNLLNTDLAETVRLGEICDRYGMDTISASNTLGLAFMLFDKGILTVEHTGGLQLTWGDTAAAAQLLHMTGRREGLGDWLAEGSLRFARRFGVEEEAVQVNGLELAYHDPRGVSGMAISYATSPRGACHNQSDYFFVDWGHDRPDIGIHYLERLEEVGKGRNVARHQDWRTIYNALTVCLFASVEPPMMADLINAACGLDWDVPEMMRFGERGWNIKRLINNRMGLDASNDRLPKRILEPFNEGGSAGYSPDLQGMLYDYYEHRGWDLETGRPTSDKLLALGLDDLDEQKIF